MEENSNNASNKTPAGGTVTIPVGSFKNGHTLPVCKRTDAAARLLISAQSFNKRYTTAEAMRAYGFTEEEYTNRSFQRRVLRLRDKYMKKKTVPTSITLSFKASSISPLPSAESPLVAKGKANENICKFCKFRTCNNQNNSSITDPSRNTGNKRGIDDPIDDVIQDVIEKFWAGDRTTAMTNTSQMNCHDQHIADERARRREEMKAMKTAKARAEVYAKKESDCKALIQSCSGDFAKLRVTEMKKMYEWKLGKKPAGLKKEDVLSAVVAAEANPPVGAVYWTAEDDAVLKAIEEEEILAEDLRNIRRAIKKAKAISTTSKEMMEMAKKHLSPEEIKALEKVREVFFEE
eukprot:CAMPEP_0172409614 /NCGR_PEP_ID=MMETSP1061-20121228/76456_1 /TAXON_ID=37318 /ORGANISM="Pseudo-nitzschia pungens, Strain cf. pungens" /LENGTH=347 /DNA_ID=CAMNT_0013145773 /DNA_START=1325 /DNA_END=2368 /DNA_ORIENTATION=+